MYYYSLYYYCTTRSNLDEGTSVTLHSCLLSFAGAESWNLWSQMILRHFRVPTNLTLDADVLQEVNPTPIFRTNILKLSNNGAPSSQRLVERLFDKVTAVPFFLIECYSTNSNLVATIILRENFQNLSIGLKGAPFLQ